MDQLFRLTALLLSLAPCSSDASEGELEPHRALDSLPTSEVDSDLEREAPVELSMERSDARSQGAHGDVHVTVVDGRGMPLDGIPVLGCEVDDAGNVRGRLHWSFAVATDGSGSAVIPERRTGSRYAAALFGRALAVSGKEDPLRIVAPPHGAIVVDLSSFPDKSRVKVAPSDGKPERFDGLPGGKLHIPYVPLGGELRITVDSDSGHATLDIQGPSEDGAIVEVVPELVRHVEIVAILVDDAGLPLEGVYASLLGAERDSTIATLGPSDERGRVSKRIRPGQLDIVEGEAAELREPWTDDPSARVLRTASLVCPAVDEDSTLDLGTITMSKPPPLVAGRVVDEGGEAVEGVRLRFAPRLAGDFDPSLPHVGFDFFDAVVGISDGEGRFELHTETPPRRDRPQQLELTIDGARGALVVPFDVGQTDLEVRVDAPGRLTVDLGYLEPSVWSQLRVEVVPDAATAAAHGRPAVDWAPGSPIPESWPVQMAGASGHAGRTSAQPVGSWSFGLHPGTYSVGVELGGVTVGRVDGVVVATGATVVDPRLDPFLLDVDLETRVLTAVDPEGSVITNATAIIRIDGGDWSAPWSRLPEAGSGVTVVMPRGMDVRVAVRAPGHAATSATDVEDGGRVVLQRLVPVTIEVRSAIGATEEVAYDDDLSFAAVDPNSPWVQAFEYYFYETPFEQAVTLPPGIALRVDSYDSPWEDMTFTVPAEGGRIVLNAQTR